MPETTGGPEEFNLTPEQAEAIKARHGLSPGQFRDLDEGLQARILQRLEVPDVHTERARHGLAAQVNDAGEIPPGSFERARIQSMEARARGAAPANRGRTGGLFTGPSTMPMPLLAEETTAGLQVNNMGWTAIGPGNIGGRIRSLLINPNNVSELWIGSVGGGVWHSLDAGATWKPANDLMANLAVCSLAMDPTDASTLYAGTGEGFFNLDAIRGDGIFKTTDGYVWQKLPSTDTADFYWVNSLAISSTGTTLLAGTRTGIWRSTDSGATWSQALAADVGNVAIDPNNDSNAVCGLLRGQGIYYSTNHGQTWTKATEPAGAGNIGRAQICYAVRDTSIVYASVEASPSQIWRSSDGGKTFSKRASTNNYLGQQGWYDNIIWAGDPSDENFVLVGGIDLYKSTDGGDSISQISLWWRAPSSPHADHHVITASPAYDGTTNNTVYFGNDGGVYMTADVKTAGTNGSHTNGWSALNNKLGITQFYAGAGSSATGTVIGGAQDNGTLRYTPAQGAEGWNSVYGGDGGYSAIDTNNANNMYGEYVTLQIFRNTAGGASNQSQYICGRYWTGAQWDWKPAPYTISDAQAGRANFIAPFALDPNDPNTLLAGGDSLWRSTDPLAANTNTTGPSWSAIKPSTGAGRAGYISAVCVAPGNSDLALVGHNNGRIYKSVNATAAAPAWARIDTNGVNAARMCTWLAIDAHDNDVFYATFGGYQANNIWRSADGGNSWSNIGAALPDAPIRCVTIHPQNSDWIYVGTEVGVFASEDSGSNWSPSNEGPTNCAVYQLFWAGNTLACATHGRSMFRTDLTIHDHADLVLSGDLGGVLAAYNPQTGAKTGSYSMAGGQITAAPLIEDTSAYCAYEQPFKIAKFDSGNLSAGPEWEAAVQGSVNATPDILNSPYDGKSQLFSAASDGKLYAIDASTGVQDWSLQVIPAPKVGSGVNSYSNQVMNQWVYVATEAGLYAVNTQTQTVGWSKDIVCKAPPLLASDTVYAGADDGKIYAIAARSGDDKWSVNTGAPVASTPAWILGSVIVGNQHGDLIGIDFDTGAVQFSEQFKNEQVQAIAADGDELYFVGNEVSGYLYGYRLNIAGAGRSISQMWKTSVSLGASRPPQIVGDYLYLTTVTKKLIAYDTTTGNQLWESALGSVALAAPALVLA